MGMVNQLGEFSPRLAKLSKQIKKCWATNNSETGEQLKRNLLQMCRSEVIMLMNLNIIFFKISIILHIYLKILPIILKLSTYAWFNAQNILQTANIYYWLNDFLL